MFSAIDQNRVARPGHQRATKGSKSHLGNPLPNSRQPETTGNVGDFQKYCRFRTVPLIDVGQRYFHHSPI